MKDIDLRFKKKKGCISRPLTALSLTILCVEVNKVFSKVWIKS